MNNQKLKAPFPYFGGESRVAEKVWEALGQPARYMEPFFGSGAVLLSRPNFDAARHVEVINDASGFVSNVWRALRDNPDAVARVCDCPLDHVELQARRKVLNASGEDLSKKLIADDGFYNAVLAGHWIYCACGTIGCDFFATTNAIPKTDRSSGIFSFAGRGGSENGEKSLNSPYSDNLYAWFRALKERLRHVHIVCGDWSRILGGNPQANIGDVGIFFDPPYATITRTKCYEQEDFSVAHDVREWCLERGKIKNYKIVLAGYFDEHKDLLSHGWSGEKWTANGGYANQGDGDTQGKENKTKEALFFSPFCNNVKQGKLFEEEEK